jgi:Fuc2NAc and GlcNAc transferase
MDGIDGLAGMQALFMLLAAACFSVWQQPHVTHVPEWTWMIAIAAAVVAFLQFNWPPATIFMGDVGSTWLAFMMVSVAAISVLDGWMTTSTWLILGGVFIVDSTTTLLRRMFRKARWFEAHRSHAYQRLAVRWRSHRHVTLLVSAINLLWLAPVAYVSLLWPQWAWFLTGVAYTPLIAASLALGAGSAGDPSSAVTRERL